MNQITRNSELVRETVILRSGLQRKRTKLQIDEKKLRARVLSGASANVLTGLLKGGS